MHYVEWARRFCSRQDAEGTRSCASGYGEDGPLPVRNRQSSAVVPVGTCRPSGDPSLDEPADDLPRDARPAGPLHVFLPVRGYAVGVQPQRERGLERDERPLALRQNLTRRLAGAGQIFL